MPGSNLPLHEFANIIHFLLLGDGSIKWFFVFRNAGLPANGVLVGFEHNRMFTRDDLACIC